MESTAILFSRHGLRVFQESQVGFSAVLTVVTAAEVSRRLSAGNFLIRNGFWEIHFHLL